MAWVTYALSTAVALAAADFCIKIASGKLSNSMGLLLYGSCTFLAGLIWVILDKTRGVDLYAQPVGILAAAGVGIAFSGVTIGLYITFGAGAPISLASPIVRLVGLLIASVAGILILHEPFTIRYIIGMVIAFLRSGSDSYKVKSVNWGEARVTKRPNLDIQEKTVHSFPSNRFRTPYAKYCIWARSDLLGFSSGLRKNQNYYVLLTRALK